MLGGDCHREDDDRMATKDSQRKRKGGEYCGCVTPTLKSPKRVLDISNKRVLVKQEVVSPLPNASPSATNHSLLTRNNENDSENVSTTTTHKTHATPKKKGRKAARATSNQPIFPNANEIENTDISVNNKPKSSKKKPKIERTDFSSNVEHCHETSEVNHEKMSRSKHRKKKIGIGKTLQAKEKQRPRCDASSSPKKSRKERNTTSTDTQRCGETTVANPSTSSSHGDVISGNVATMTTANLTAEEGTQKDRSKRRKTSKRVQFSAQNRLHENWRFTKKEIDELKKKGIKVKFGAFSKDETDLLRRNVEQFLKDHNLTDPKPLILNRKNAPAQVQAESAVFFKTVAQGIDRPIFNIYRRLRRMYDPDHLAGKWTKEETDEMLRFYAMYPRQWTRIGKLIGRSGQAVAHRYTQNVNFAKELGSSEPWSADEIERLNGAIRAVTNTDFNTRIISQIPWVAVAEFVGTRTSNNCRQKWIRDICWVDAHGKKDIKWTNEDDIELIERLYEYEAVDESDIDWLELSKKMPHSPSHDWLRTRWSILKRVVPDYQQDITLEDILDYLYNKHLPVLKAERPVQVNKSAELIDARYNEPGYVSRKQQHKK